MEKQEYTMKAQLARTELLIGRDALERLEKAKVAIFGVGGVGGFAVEALARSGVGRFLLVDDDTVALSNLNRQIIATRRTIGRNKVEVMRERIWEINPEAEIEIRQCFFLPENADTFDFSEYSYVIDAVDTVSAKLAIIRKAKECGTPVISSMGAGNKLDPTKFQVADIHKTSVCPLAKVMRRECKKRGIKDVKVVFSTEDAITPAQATEAGAEEPTDAMQQRKGAPKRSTPGSIAFVPSVAGLILAGEVIKDLIGWER